jgi:hypothetical protein
MGTVKTFEDLEIWKLSRKLCPDIFRITGYELFSKDFGLKVRSRLRENNYQQ